MSIYNKVSGSYHTVTGAYVKVSGAWHSSIVYNKINGVWTQVFPEPIPAGLILISGDGTVPTDWASYTAANGKMIVGAGSAYALNSTGGSSTVSGLSASSSSTGAHSNHTNYGVTDVPISPSTTGYTTDGYSDGNHSHTVSITSYTPAKRNSILIQAQKNLNKIPANVMALGTYTPSGFSVHTTSDNYYIAASTSNTNVAQAVTSSCSYSGDHTHGSSSVNAGVLDESDGGNSRGSHNHPLTLAIANNFKALALRAVYKAQDYGIAPGLIGMWNGGTVPTGWHLCDGNAGTVNLIDYFVMCLQTGSGTLVGSGAGGFSASVTLNSISWDHNHSGGYNDNTSGSSSNYAGNGGVAHGHTATLTKTTYLPPYYALTFIQYLGV